MAKEDVMQIGTQVFQVIVREQRQAGREEARLAGVKALAETMRRETIRFGTFDEKYVEECAAERLDFYLSRPAIANCGNQVIPRAS